MLYFYLRGEEMDRRDLNKILNQIQSCSSKLKRLVDKDNYPELDKIIEDIIEVSFIAGFTRGSNSQCDKMAKLRIEMDKIKKEGVNNGYQPRPEEVYKERSDNYVGD
jgi:hypothetical protein